MRKVMKILCHSKASAKNTRDRGHCNLTGQETGKTKDPVRSLKQKITFSYVSKSPVPDGLPLWPCTEGTTWESSSGSGTRDHLEDTFGKELGLRHYSGFTMPSSFIIKHQNTELLFQDSEYISKGILIKWSRFTINTRRWTWPLQLIKARRRVGGAGSEPPPSTWPLWVLSPSLVLVSCANTMFKWLNSSHSLVWPSLSQAKMIYLLPYPPPAPICSPGQFHRLLTSFFFFRHMHHEVNPEN